MLIGDYFHPGYGILQIRMKKDRLWIIPKNQSSEFQLTHWQNNAFRIQDACFTLPWLLEFQLSDENQSVKGFDMSLVGFFEKIPISKFGFLTHVFQ